MLNWKYWRAELEKMLWEEGTMEAEYILFIGYLYWCYIYDKWDNKL